MEDASARDPLIGVTIGNYLIEAKLGAGGMGAVYLARHPLIGKQVALKVLHADLSADERMVARFFNEARAVNEIKHPNIVDIIDFGELPGQMPKRVYFIMEFLEGESLEALLRRQTSLPVERALGVAWQIADALAASHAAGIIHCDLKPDNVMMLQRGRQRDFVKVLDFGIAKLMGGPQQTRTGVIMGTPAYMSPEQCEGRSNIDHRTDVYALGVLLYRMLTGRVPFRGAGYRQVLMQHMTRSPALPSSIRREISPYVDAVVMKALAKQPHARYPGMDELMKALDAPAGYVEEHGGLDAFVAGAMARVAVTILDSTVMRGPTRRFGTEPLTDTVATAPGQPAPPDAPRQVTTLSASSSSMESVPQPRWSRPARLAAGLAALLGLTVGAILLAQQRGEQAASATDARQQARLDGTDEQPAAGQDDTGGAGALPAAPLAPEQSAPGQSAPQQPAPQHVAIEITSKPDGAEVFVGSEEQPRGRTPLTIELPESEERVTIALRRSGYKDRVEQIVPREPGQFTWRLSRARPQKRSPGPDTGEQPPQGIPPPQTLPPVL